MPWPGASAPETMFSRVDLPAPLGPIRARISPRRTWNDTSSRACSPPNRIPTRWTSSMIAELFIGHWP
ncbi:Uncharacterised protein [Bordetella pertussis]|nr:Uncharacterised protein [Bordetella pertussis]CFP59960.1 Uncharacterised protein [Bordetella pertussis]